MAERNLLSTEVASGSIDSDLVLHMQPSTVVRPPNYTLIGRFLCSKLLNCGVIQSMIQKLRNYGCLVVTSYLGPNIYYISTDSLVCYNKILEDCPWHFMGKFFNVKERDFRCSMDEVDMSTAVFWAQMHNLLLEYMHLDNAPTIGKQLGTVLKVDSFHQGMLLRSFLRIRILFLWTSRQRLDFG